MSRSKSKRRKERALRKEQATTAWEQKPRILVLEGLAGATDAVRDAGGRAWQEAPYDMRSVDKILSDPVGIHGLLLTGGGDVNPEVYGAEKDQRVHGISDTRDLVEYCALEVAKEQGWPVLGICRGSQIMNAWAGGTLQQHIAGHTSSSHWVLTSPGSVAKKAAGGGFKVVSLHHQQVDKIAPGFSVTGWDPFDRVTEMIESDDGQFLGVQFHPEMDEFEDYAKGIFDWLVAEAAKRAGLPEPVREERVESKWHSYYDQKAWLQDGTERGIYDGNSYGLSCTADDDDVLSLPAGFVEVEPDLQLTVDEDLANIAGELRATGAATTNPISYRWACPRCQIVFDLKDDQVDHMRYLHGEVWDPKANKWSKVSTRETREYWGRDSEAADIECSGYANGCMCSNCASTAALKAA